MSQLSLSWGCSMFAFFPPKDSYHCPGLHCRCVLGTCINAAGSRVSFPAKASRTDQPRTHSGSRRQRKTQRDPSSCTLSSQCHTLQDGRPARRSWGTASQPAAADAVWRRNSHRNRRQTSAPLGRFPCLSTGGGGIRGTGALIGQEPGQMEGSHCPVPGHPPQPILTPSTEPVPSPPETPPLQTSPPPPTPHSLSPPASRAPGAHCTPGGRPEAVPSSPRRSAAQPTLLRRGRPSPGSPGHSAAHLPCSGRPPPPRSLVPNFSSPPKSPPLWETSPRQVRAARQGSALLTWQMGCRGSAMPASGPRSTAGERAARIPRRCPEHSRCPPLARSLTSQPQRRSRSLSRWLSSFGEPRRSSAPLCKALCPRGGQSARAQRRQPPNGDAARWGRLALIYYLELQGKRGQAAPIDTEPNCDGRAGSAGGGEGARSSLQEHRS